MQLFLKMCLCCCYTALLLFALSVNASPKVVERLARTQITLVDAINIAESTVSGRAYKAKLETNSFGLEYEVELIVEDSRVEVSVDALTREVIKVRHK